jgi:uncharacterized protein (TIGR00255 family)
MLRSMTGFGSAPGVVEGVEYAVEARSVNNRYFKASIKVPESWVHAESDIEKLIRKRVSRGTVTLTVRMKVPDDQAAYRVNVAVVKRYVEQLREIAVEDDSSFRIDLGAMLQLPGVCEAPSLEDLCQKTRAGLMDLVTRALDNLVRMRGEDGKAVEVDLRSNCDTIERKLSEVAESAPRVLEAYHERLAGRAAELASSGRAHIDQDTLAREVAIYAERSDIAEEISRLMGHVEQFRQALESQDPGGRKLDFIAQEMLREANTIASKSSDVDIAAAVVEIKTSVDRIKEQVQNVE